MKLYTTSDEREKKFLDKPAKPVDFKTADKKELREFVKRMRDMMTRAQGVGLSANQVGDDRRLFVANVPTANGKTKFYAIVNPRIVKRSAETEALEEGCLSVPDTYGTIERAASVVLEGFTPAGRKVKIKAWGLLAQVFQHEVDHLDGHLFTEKAKPVFHVDEDTGHAVRI